MSSGSKDIQDRVATSFQEKVSEKVRIVPEGANRFRVFTPFQFDDRDHLSIVLKRVDGLWQLSDEGHTYMHLSYDLPEKELHKGTRAKIISNALDAFSVEDREGELIASVIDERFGDALFDFVQAILKNQRCVLSVSRTSEVDVLRRFLPASCRVLRRGQAEL